MNMDIIISNQEPKWQGESSQVGLYHSLFFDQKRIGTSATAILFFYFTKNGAKCEGWVKEVPFVPVTIFLGHPRLSGIPAHYAR